jgi:hypothetical protein
MRNSVAAAVAGDPDAFVEVSAVAALLGSGLARPPCPELADQIEKRHHYLRLVTVVLQQGSAGAAVVVLQRGLKVTPDGAFGPKTRAAL